MLLRLFTRVPLDEILKLCKDDIVSAKRIMAYEITKLVHGQEEANKVVKAVLELFENNSVSDNIPKVQLNKELIENSINLVDLLVMTKFISSKSEAKRLIVQGGICINNEKVDSIQKELNSSDLIEDYIVLKRGKKNYLKVIFN